VTIVFKWRSYTHRRCRLALECRRWPASTPRLGCPDPSQGCLSRTTPRWIRGPWGKRPLAHAPTSWETKQTLNCSSARIRIRQIKHLTLKQVQILFNNSVRTAKKTQLFTVTRIKRLTLFKEITSFSYRTRKYKLNSYRFLRQVVHIVPTSL
jgi:hypothetical protein